MPLFLPPQVPYPWVQCARLFNAQSPSPSPPRNRASLPAPPFPPLHRTPLPFSHVFVLSVLVLVHR
jgi:hypothetical protein